MSSKDKQAETDKRVLLTKAIAFGVVAATLLGGFIATPKSLFKDDSAYTLAVGTASLSDDNLLLHSYKVYPTDEKFKDGLVTDVNKTLAAFKERNEVMVVKIPGIKNVSYETDYILVQDPTTPDLNIEYYLASNMEIVNTSVSCRTAVSLIQSIMNKINILYLVLIILLYVGFFSLFSYKCLKYVFRYKGTAKADIHENHRP